MFKFMMMFKKKPELTREQFMDYYDNAHIPNMRKIMPVGSSCHRRNFVIPGPNHGPDDYDCITEVFYKERSQAEAAGRAMADPQIRKFIDEDEDRFILKGSMKVCMIEVHESVFEPLEGFGAQAGVYAPAINATA